MYLVLLLAAVGVISVITIITKRSADNTLAVGGVVLGLVLIILCWVPSLVIGGLQPEIETVKRTNILCIKDNSEIKGRFSLFTGSINERMYYHYYVVDSDGAVLLEKTPVDSVSVYEDAPAGEGYILEYHTKHKAAGDWGCTPPSHRGKREIHVPPDTGTRQFVLDAED